MRSIVCLSPGRLRGRDRAVLVAWRLGQKVLHFCDASICENVRSEGARWGGLAQKWSKPAVEPATRLCTWQSRRLSANLARWCRSEDNCAIRRKRRLHCMHVIDVSTPHRMVLRLGPVLQQKPGSHSEHAHAGHHWRPLDHAPRGCHPVVRSVKPCQQLYGEQQSSPHSVVKEQSRSCKPVTLPQAWVQRSPAWGSKPSSRLSSCFGTVKQAHMSTTTARPRPRTKQTPSSWWAWSCRA